MAEPDAKRALRTLTEAATATVGASGRGVEPFRGIALHDTGKDETFTSLAAFDETSKTVASLALVQQRYGVDEAPRVTLQFVYEWLDRVDQPHFQEEAFDHLWEDFSAELDDPDWVFRLVANVRWLTAQGGPFDLGDGVSIRGRSFEELRELRFSQPTLDALSEDFYSGSGPSSYVMLVETRVPKSPDNFILGSVGTDRTKASRVVGALRLLAPGDISIGRMWMSRPARFNVGLGGVQSAGFSIPAMGSSYHLTDPLAAEVPEMVEALSHLEERGYGTSPGNLGLALRSFMATYDRWPSSGDSRVLDAITAVEAVLGSGTEIAFKLSFRMAGVLGGDEAERAAIFREMKAYYDLRSKLVHGAALKEKHHALLADPERLRHLVRELLRGFVHLATTPGHGYGKAWFQEHLDVALQVESERVALREALNLRKTGNPGRNPGRR